MPSHCSRSKQPAVLQGSGDQDYVASLRARSSHLGLGPRVTFSQEPREWLPKVYADADAVVFPVTWNEPWGLVPLEAMAVGRPVVATGTGGSAEYLRDGENVSFLSHVTRRKHSPAQSCASPTIRSCGAKCAPAASRLRRGSRSAL